MITTLTLTVASPAVRVPEPDTDHPDTQVWYTADWEPHAWFYPVGDEYWVRLSEIGTFRVATNGSVLAFPEPGTPFGLLVDAYRRTVLPQALQFFGREVLHASAVVVNGNVVGFSAYSKTGKSTLAFALAQRGYEPWSDDALAFETGTDGARTLALPFAVRLRPESRDHFGKWARRLFPSPQSACSDVPTKACPGRPWRRCLPERSSRTCCRTRTGRPSPMRLGRSACSAPTSGWPARSTYSG